MCDSGRITKYQDSERLWRIDCEGGESSWVVADNAGDALKEHLSISDDGCDDFKVSACKPTESITVIGEDRKDYPDAFLEAEEDDEEYDGPMRFTANAAEWVEYVIETLKPKSGSYYLCGTEY